MCSELHSFGTTGKNMLCCIILRNIDNKNPKCAKERYSYFFCGLEKDDFKRLD